MRRSREKSNVRCKARHSSTTPRLLAKWAGRMLRTRTSSSRISWVSWVSWSSLSLCKSAGDWIVGRIALMLCHPLLDSSIPLHHVANQGLQAAAGRAQGLQMGDGLLAQPFRAAAALGHAQETGVGQLTAGGVL